VELHALSLTVTEADLNAIVGQLLRPDAAVRNVQVKMIEGAVQVSGTYPKLLVPVPFTATWATSAEAGKLCLRLTGLSVVGVPAGMFRGVVFTAAGRLAVAVPGVTVEGDRIVIPVEAVLQTRGIPLVCHLKVVRCMTGKLVIQA